VTVHTSWRARGGRVGRALCGLCLIVTGACWQPDWVERDIENDPRVTPDGPVVVPDAGEEAPDAGEPDDVLPCCDCTAIVLPSGQVADCVALLGTADAYCANFYADDGQPDFQLIGACGQCNPTFFSPPDGAEVCIDGCVNWPDVCVAFCGSDAVLPATWQDGACTCPDPVYAQLVADCPDWTCYGPPGGIGERCVPEGTGRYTCEFPGVQVCDGSTQCSTCEGDWASIIDYGDGSRCRCQCDGADADAGVDGTVSCSMVE
jgi:hypothetical protein